MLLVITVRSQSTGRVVMEWMVVIVVDSATSNRGESSGDRGWW